MLMFIQYLHFVYDMKLYLLTAFFIPKQFVTIKQSKRVYIDQNRFNLFTYILDRLDLATGNYSHPLGYTILDHVLDTGIHINMAKL